MFCYGSLQIPFYYLANLVGLFSFYLHPLRVLILHLNDSLTFSGSGPILREIILRHSLYILNAPLLRVKYKETFPLGEGGIGV